MNLFREVNRECTPQEIAHILINLANTLALAEIRTIFAAEDGDVLSRIDEALGLEASFRRPLNSSTIIRDIESLKKEIYADPTRLSEEVYTRLIAILAAK
jgi:hypothetical protein